jgi:hypothetical protein
MGNLDYRPGSLCVRWFERWRWQYIAGLSSRWQWSRYSMPFQAFITVHIMPTPRPSPPAKLGQDAGQGNLQVLASAYPKRLFYKRFQWHNVNVSMLFKNFQEKIYDVTNTIDPRLGKLNAKYRFVETPICFLIFFYRSFSEHVDVRK